jgi:hypothetical protein
VEVSANGVVMLDMFVVLADRLEATWRVGDPPTPPDGSLMEASTAAIAPADDLQHSRRCSVLAPNPQQAVS